MTYKLLTMLAPIKGEGARPGTKLTKINGVTIHMTDNWGIKSDAKAHATYLRNGGSDNLASWHYCVDDTYATQSIPDDEVAYHSANEIGNTTTISIEICLNPESDLKKACDNAAHLAASLMKKYSLSINKLYRHYDWSGKWCPSQIMNGKPYTWSEFKNKVKALLEETTSNGIIGVGATVKFDGKSRCYTSSTGGIAGVIPPAGHYKVTHYNPGTPYSVHIGTYGWVPASNCGLTVSKNMQNSVVKFDGKSHCYATSNGEGKGIIPPSGNYKVTYYNENSKYPVHIGSYGWVPEENCKVL